MLRPIQFNDYFGVLTDEIHNVWPNRMLAAKS